MSIIDGKDAATRKSFPLTTGCLDYFPDALLEVANLSRLGNEQHNPGQPMHWDRTKSTDHADCISRHLIDRGKLDSDGVRHSAKVAWRALALLQMEIEQERAAVSATPVGGHVSHSTYSGPDRRVDPADRRQILDEDASTRFMRRRCARGRRITDRISYWDLPKK